MIVDALRPVALQDLPTRAMAFVALDEAQIEGWRNFRGPPFPIRTIEVPGGAPAPAAATEATDKDSAAAAPPLALQPSDSAADVAAPSAAEDGLTRLLEAVARCIAPGLVARQERTDRACQRLQGGVRALNETLTLKEAQLAAKQAEVDGLTTSLQQSILQLKAVSEMSKQEKEKHRNAR